MLDIKEVDAENYYQIKIFLSKDLSVSKDFLDRLLENFTHYEYIAFLDWVQVKKVTNNLDDTYLQQFNTFKTQIGKKIKDHTKIKEIFFFIDLDKPI